MTIEAMKWKPASTSRDFMVKADYVQPNSQINAKDLLIELKQGDRTSDQPNRC